MLCHSVSRSLYPLALGSARKMKMATAVAKISPEWHLFIVCLQQGIGLARIADLPCAHTQPSAHTANSILFINRQASQIDELHDQSYNIISTMELVCDHYLLLCAQLLSKYGTVASTFKTFAVDEQ